MVEERIKAFWEKAKTDKDLQSKLQKLNGMDLDSALAEGATIATEAGFKVTADELRDNLDAVQTGFRTLAANEDRELSDEEIKNVAGGYVCMGLECLDEFEGTYLCGTICCIDVVTS